MNIVEGTFNSSLVWTILYILIVLGSLGIMYHFDLLDNYCKFISKWTGKGQDLRNNSTESHSTIVAIETPVQEVVVAKKDLPPSYDAYAPPKYEDILFFAINHQFRQKYLS